MTRGEESPRLRVGIVGPEERKWSERGKKEALELIRRILSVQNVQLVSGRCPRGGVDIWAEEIALELGIPALIHPPREHSWKAYRERNMAIVRDSEELHVVTEAAPVWCKHCETRSHVSSGGCWTGQRSPAAIWHLV